MNSNEITPRNRAERRTAGKRARAAGAALTAGSAALAMGAAWVGTGIESAHAASTFTVTQDTDTGNSATVGSLSWAIDQANNDAGSTIDFDLPGGTLTVTSGPVTHVRAPVTITGPGSAALTIDLQGGHRAFYIESSASDVTISGLTFANGESDNQDPDGGAILSKAGLTVSESVFSGNNAEGDGGAIYFDAEAALTLTNDEFSTNSAFYDGGAVAVSFSSGVTISGTGFDQNTSGEAGGALYHDSGIGDAVAITDSRFIENHSGQEPDTEQGRAGGGGGAIFDYDGEVAHSLTISGTTISGNVAETFGGGGVQMYSDAFGAVASITDSIVSGNFANYSGGGLYFYGTNGVTVLRTTVSDNHASVSEGGTGGGGIFVGSGTGELAIGESTISGNDGNSGGGLWLYADQTVRIFNSTVSGNTANFGGGGLSMYGPTEGLYLTQDTITNNTGNDGLGGLYIFNNLAPAAQSHAQARAKKANVHSAEQEKGGAKSKSVKAQRVHAQGVHDVTALNTILSGNIGGDAGGTSFPMLASHNVLGTIDASVNLTDQGGNVFSGDPGVGPLAGNGGPTLTHELLPGSPAIDAGAMPVKDFPGNADDQRGAGFARVVAGTVDIGAFEVQAPAPIDIAPKFTG